MKSNQSKTKTELIQELQSLRKSEQNLRTLFETMSQGVVYQDSDGNIISANPAAERILGLSFDQMQGRTSIDPRWHAIHEDGSDFPGETHPAMVSLKTRQPVNNIVMGVFHPVEGKHHWISIDAIPQFTPGEKKPYQVYTTFTDITERKKAEKALHEREQEFRTLVESAPDVISRFDREFRHIYINPAVEQESGMPPEFFIGKTNIELGTPEDVITQWHEAIKSVFKTGQDITVETKIPTPDGIRYYSNRIAAEFAEDGTITSVLNITRNITESKQAEEQLKKQFEELRLQSEIMDNMVEGVYLIGLDDVIIRYTNPKFEEMFGYGPGEMLGKHASIVNAPTDKDPRETAKEIMDIIYETGEWHGEVNNIKKDGTTFWCYANVSIFNHQQYGKVLVSIHTDITERKQVEEALRESENQLRLITDNTSDNIAITTFDLKAEYIYVNPSVKSLFGYDPEDLIGKSFFDFIHPDDKKALLPLLKSYLNKKIKKLITGKEEEITETIEFRFKDKIGDWRFLQSTVNIVGNQLLAVTRDITERKQFEIALQETNILKELLLDIITHDLKNPAGVISTVSEMVLEERSDDEKMQIIKDSSENLLKVIDNATILSQIALGEKVMMEKTDLVEVIQKVAKDMTSKIDNAGMMIKLDFPKKLLVQANPIIADVFSNYISNAVKYASKGKKIFIDHTVSDDGYVVINVKDLGTTIPEENRQNIFDRNLQLERGEKRGRGLGLAIVKRIAEVHGAEVGVKPNIPKGNIFYVKIPIN